MINSQADMRLVGKAADGNQAVTLFKELKPDVIILDLKMPVMNGLNAREEIKKLDDETPVLVLTSFADDDMVISAIQLGANGVMLKDWPCPNSFWRRFYGVVQGQSPVHPAITHKLMLKNTAVRNSGACGIFVNRPGDGCAQMCGARSIEQRNCVEIIHLYPHRDHPRAQYPG